MIKVSFECENSQYAELLMTLYDILNAEEDADYSNMALDNMGWLFDEVLLHLVVAEDEIDKELGTLAKMAIREYKRLNEENPVTNE